MKKNIILLLIVLFITGCSSSIEYNFEKDIIKSNIEINFNNQEYLDKIKTITNEYNNTLNENNVYEDILNNVNNTLPTAYEDDDKTLFYYNKTSFENKNNEYNLKYDFNFNYETFKKNYYLNNCFDFYAMNEDESFYHINIKGNFTCNNYDNLKIKVKSSKEIYNASSAVKKNGYYIWNIKEQDNDIYFAISKTNENKPLIQTYKITFGIIIFVLILIIALIYKKVTSTYN